jgi:hypothetical protein
MFNTPRKLKINNISKMIRFCSRGTVGCGMGGRWVNLGTRTVVPSAAVAGARARPYRGGLAAIVYVLEQARLGVVVGGGPGMVRGVGLRAGRGLSPLAVGLLRRGPGCGPGKQMRSPRPGYPKGWSRRPWP